MNWESLTKMVLMGLNRTVISLSEEADIHYSDMTDPRSLLEALVTSRQKRRAATSRPYISLNDSPNKEASVSNDLIAPLGLFERIFYGGLDRIIPETLYWLTKTQVKIAPEFTPEWMKWLSEHHTYADEVRKSLAKSSKMLVAWNAEWRIILGTPLLSDWSHGSLSARKVWLKYQCQKAPAIAIAELEKVWSKEPADVRQAFLQIVIQENTSGAQTLLQSAIMDRSLLVRILGVKGLIKSGDHKVISLINRAFSEGLSIEEGRWSWENHDSIPDLLLGLLSARTKKSKHNANQQMLQLMVPFLEPDYVKRINNLTDEETIDRLSALSDINHVVESSLLYNHNQWMVLILQGILNNRPEYQDISRHHLTRLMRKVPLTQLHEVLTDYIPEHGRISNASERVIDILFANPQTWSMALTSRIVNRLHFLEQQASYEWDLQKSFQHWLTQTCLHGAPFYYDELRSLLFRSRTGWKEWDSKVDTLLKTLHFRKEMIGYFHKMENKRTNGKTDTSTSR